MVRKIGMEGERDWGGEAHTNSHFWAATPLQSPVDLGVMIKIPTVTAIVFDVTKSTRISY